MISQEKLRELFDYHPDGVLIWKVSRSCHVRVGQIAGNIHKSTGRRRVVIGYSHYFSYRLIFAWHYGYFPKIVDHIDRDCTNDRIENLRDVTDSQSSMNRGLQSNNTSGIVGVYWDVSVGKWHSQIKINRKNKNLGSFDNLSDAIAARQAAEKVMFGQYSANINNK